MYYLLITLYIISCFVLIMFVLLQPSKSDASGVFGGGGANSSAFGPRGTQTVLAKITIAAAICFFLIAFLFSIPGLFGKKSLGEGVGPASTQPAPDTGLPTTLTPTDIAPPEAPATTPATPPANSVTPKSGDKPAAKPADAKKPEAKPADNKKPK